MLFVFCLLAKESKTFMVTAATGSLGKAICEKFALDGHNLVLAGRNEKKVEKLKRELAQKYPQILIYSVLIDFSKRKNIKQTCQNFFKIKYCFKWNCSYWAKT